ncbi:MAG: hypothetical protein Q7U51_05310 [Methanoregula sp.]|nr:hypothetical protein [Methanoregula sp.]
MSGCTNNAGSQGATSTPPSVLTTEVTPLPPTPVQVAIPQTGVWLRVTYPGNYTGTYGSPGYQTPVKDTGDHFYQIATVMGPVVASIKKQDGSGDKIVIAIYKDGMLIKEESTIVPYRLIEFSTDLKTPTPTTYPTPVPLTPVPTAQVTTETSIPNLVGTWNVNAQGAVIQKYGAPGEWTHHSGQYSILTAQAIVTDQKDRVLHGTFKAPLGKEESFIGVIGMDNKSFYYADQDGINDGQIVSNGQINMVYRQVSANDTVVAVGTWTLVK